MAENSTLDWDASGRLDASVDELVSYGMNVEGVFAIRSESGDMEPASLCAGLPTTSTYRKTYEQLKDQLANEQCQDIYDMQQEAHMDHQAQLERVLAPLSDAQFKMLAKILACSPKPRHRMYITICAMIFPQDLELLQNTQAYRHSDASNLTPPEPPPIPFQAFPRSALPPATSDTGQRPRSESWKHLYIKFSRDDVEGAGDLLLKIVLHMRQSLGSHSDNILLLQLFAGHSRTISKQLLRIWASKWPLAGETVDELTLDLRQAYTPDDVFLPTKEWLQTFYQNRYSAPTVLKILAPTKQLETETYSAFGVDV